MTRILPLLALAALAACGAEAAPDACGTTTFDMPSDLATRMARVAEPVHSDPESP